MKKKIFLVFGNSAGIEMNRCKELAEKFHNEEDEINISINVESKTAEDALLIVIDKLRLENANYQNSLLLYSGENLHLLERNVSIDSLNIFRFKTKLIELIGGFDTPQQKYLVGCLFVGGLIKLINDENSPN